MERAYSHEVESEPRPSDPVRDDVANRRIQQANRSGVPKHYPTPSYLSLHSGSPAPSVKSERSR